MEEPALHASITRSPSADSSALSNIDVGGSHGDDFAANASTPPTSIADSRSIHDSGKDADDLRESARPRRARTGPTSYNVNEITRMQAKAQPLTRKRPRADDNVATPRKLSKTQTKATGQLPSAKKQLDLSRRLKNAGSYFGKTSRQLVAVGKRKLDFGRTGVNDKVRRVLQKLDTGRGGLLDELDLDASFPAPGEERPRKKLRKEAPAPVSAIPTPKTITGPLQKTSDGRRVKKWQEAGLYVGQSLDTDPARLHKKPSSKSTAEPTKAPFLPLPMFKYLDQTRNFTIPYDVFAPSLRKGDEKPKDWHKINRNRLVGEAKELWEKGDRLPVSVCVCSEPGPGEQGCDEDCLNRVMQYECNADNCCLPAALCSNRAFVELGQRIKKGGAYDVGVEVVKTANRGFGVRATRSFKPGQIIMEYTGEIISEGECQRRMREEYKNAACYYLMELERNLVIDGTRGSMARFINHSCAPNCEVRMVKVNGTPRMAVYAGDGGIMTGEELTYDYNFDNFGETRQNCYCGAATCRGFLSKRLNATEQKKALKAEEERRRLAALEAQKAAEKEAKKKQAKAARGSNWRGWVAVDDAEVKEELRAAKRAREEAEVNSSRAARLAARRMGLPAKAVVKGKAKADPKRRLTTGDLKEKESKAQATTSRRRRSAMDEVQPEVAPAEETAPATASITLEAADTPMSEDDPAATIVLQQTTVTLHPEANEVEIHQKTEVRVGGEGPKKSAPAVKLKQSTLNFAKVA